VTTYSLIGRSGRPRRAERPGRRAWVGKCRAVLAPDRRLGVEVPAIR